MRGRAAQVDARHRVRGANRRSHIWSRQALALEDVAAREPDARLDVGRAEHLPLDHAVGDVGREPGDRGQGRVGDLVAPLVPRAGRERVGHELGEHAHRVEPRRRDRASYAVWK